MTGVIPKGSIEQLDKETADVLARQATIRKVALEIEVILLREDFTMGELGEVLDLFNTRAHSVFSKTKLKKVKDDFDRPNQ